MAVAAQITLTPLNFHRHRRRLSFSFSGLPFPFSLRNHIYAFAIFAKDMQTSRHTHTLESKPNIIENQNFKVNTAAAVGQQEKRNKRQPGRPEESSD